MNEDFARLLEDLYKLQETINEVSQDLEDLIDTAVELQYEINSLINDE